MRVEAGVEARRVEPDGRRVLLQIRQREALLVREQAIVIRPELALLVGALARLGRRPRVLVIGQRVFPIDEMNPVAVGVEDLLEGRTDPLTERSLKVAEVDHLHRRARRSP